MKTSAGRGARRRHRSVSDSALPPPTPGGPSHASRRSSGREHALSLARCRARRLGSSSGTMVCARFQPGAAMVSRTGRCKRRCVAVRRSGVFRSRRRRLDRVPHGSRRGRWPPRRGNPALNECDHRVVLRKRERSPAVSNHLVGLSTSSADPRPGEEDAVAVGSRTSVGASICDVTA